MACLNNRNITPQLPILLRSSKDIICSDVTLSTLESHTLVESYLSFSERLSCNYKGHSDHTLRALFHTRHNRFISGVIRANYEWCTGTCRVTSNFPAVQVQVKGTYTIIGNSSAQQKEHRKEEQKRPKKGAWLYIFLSRDEAANKKDNSIYKKANMSCNTVKAWP